MKFILLVLGLGFAFWFFILRKGSLSFWRLAGRYPDDAYDFFKARGCWQVFEDGLPPNYRDGVPERDWTGPFLLYVPKLGRTVRVFGLVREIEQSQQEFMGQVVEK